MRRQEPEHRVRRRAQPDEAAAKAAAGGIFYNQGEVCTAASRLLVERSIKDEFVAMVVEAGRKMQPRHPLEPGAPMGAMVDQIQMDRVLGYIDKGAAEGAKLALGGTRVTERDRRLLHRADGIRRRRARDDDFARRRSSDRCCRSSPSTREQDAVRIANDSPYGLAAGVWTSDLSRAHRVARKLRAGSVWVNYWDGGDMTAPFGGYKQSGNGRDKSLHAFEQVHRGQGDLDQPRALSPGGAVDWAVSDKI